MVGIEEDRQAVLLARRFHERRRLRDADEFTLAFGDADHHGQLELQR